MLRRSASLLKFTVVKRGLASISTGTATNTVPRSHPIRKILLRTSFAVSLFYAGGLALTEYNDSFGDIFVENVPFAEGLVDFFETQLSSTLSPPPLTLDELRTKFGGMLGGKVSTVPTQGVLPQSVDPKDLQVTIPTSLESKTIGNATDSAKHSAALLVLSPIKPKLKAESKESSKFVDIINRLNDTIEEINSQKIALSEEQVSFITEAHQKLSTSVSDFAKNFQAIVSEGISSNNEQALKELNEKYAQKLKDDEAELTNKVLNEFYNYKTELEQRTSKQLAEDLKANEQTLLAKHANEVALLSITQVDEFNKILKEKLDTERNGRLSHLEELDTGVGNLTQSVDRLNDLLMRNETITQLTITLDELKAKLHSPDSRSLNIEKDLKKLKTLSNILPDKPKSCCKSKQTSPQLIDVAITELDNLAGKKEILSTEQLYNRWNLLENDFKTSSLLPPNAGILGHTFAKFFSFFLFTKQGTSPTNTDLDSVFAKVNEDLRLSKLDKAVEEVVALQGWPYVLCKDWIKEARRKLEVETLIDVLYCEVRTL